MNMYVVMKLISGEHIMCVLKEEDDLNVLVENPMVMRTILDFEAGKEKITASPLCPFSDDTNFVLDKKNVMYIKKLHHVFVSHYLSVVQDYAETTNFVPHNSEDSLHWDEEPYESEKKEPTLEDVLQTLDEDIDWDEKLKMLVKGNDTIN